MSSFKELKEEIKQLKQERDEYRAAYNQEVEDHDRNYRAWKESLRDKVATDKLNAKLLVATVLGTISTILLLILQLT